MVARGEVIYVHTVCHSNISDQGVLGLLSAERFGQKNILTSEVVHYM